MTYLLLNLLFMIVIFGLLYISGYLQTLKRWPLLATLAILIITTAVFDNFIITLGLVTYDTAKILGLYIGKAPIEDFSYAFVVAILVPVLWRLSGRRND